MPVTYSSAPLVTAAVHALIVGRTTAQSRREVLDLAQPTKLGSGEPSGFPGW